MKPARRLQQGIFLVLEGLDGAGKTTQTQLLCERLQQDGYPVVRLKEPTDGPWGQKIRQWAMQGRRVPPLTELEWFLSDRQEDVTQHIMPALQRQHIVVLDRYYFSTMAYQGALGLDVAMLQARNEAFAPRPDVLFLLDIAPDLGLQRVHQRGVANVFERLDYLERVAQIFAQLDLPYLRRLDATQEPGVIHAQIWQEVQQLVQQREIA